MRNSNIYGNTSIKRKMILSFGIVILVLFSANVLSIYKSYEYNNQYKILVDNTYKESRLKELSKTMRSAVMGVKM